MNILKLSGIFALALLVAACANVTTTTTDSGVVKAEESSNALSPQDKEIAKIEQHIARIMEKLKDEPTVKGWVLVGDANMHLKRYNEAVWAYREAYLMSDFASGPRNKLRRAIYLAGLEPENQRYEDE